MKHSYLEGGLLCLLLSLFFNECRSIVMRSVGVPHYAVKGKDIVLSCDYDTEGLALYSVKWYKNGLEFYRYLPAAKKPMTVYARYGVNVVAEKSDERQVTLTQLQLETTGRYRCEVSTEAPSFATVSNYGDMVVVVIPKSGPKIQGGKTRYSPGENVDVNCTSEESKPAADLDWFINGEPVDPSYLVKYPIRNTTNDLHTRVLGLRFAVSDADFNPGGGDLKLKCSASIGSVYWKSNEKSAAGIKTKRASLEEMGPQSYYGNSVADSSARASAFGGASSSSSSQQKLFLLMTLSLWKLASSWWAQSW